MPAGTLMAEPPAVTPAHQAESGIACFPRTSAAGLYALLDTVQNPLNVGAAVRVAAATGAALTFTGYSVPLTQRKAKAGAVGLEGLVPVAYEPDFESAAAACRRAGLRLVGTSPRASVPHTAYDLRQPFALVLGNEVSGLSPAKQALLDDVVRIPMQPGVDSLNVVVALAVILYEALRQRG